jgi:hypothetical protein
MDAGEAVDGAGADSRGVNREPRSIFMGGREYES